MWIILHGEFSMPSLIQDGAAENIITMIHRAKAPCCAGYGSAGARLAKAVTINGFS